MGQRMGPRANLEWCRNLVPKTGFNLQTVQPLASSYTHAMKTYRGSSGKAPL